MKLISKVLDTTLYSIGALLVIMIVSIQFQTKPVTIQDAKDIFKDIRSIVDMKARTITFKIVRSPGVINAYATSAGEIKVTTGMINFVKNKEELAAIIGHEYAHHMLGHLENFWFYRLQEGSERLGKFSTSDYREAMSDLLGMQLMTSAGYSACKAKNLWLRMTSRYGHRYDYSGSHPNSLARARNFKLFCEGK